MARLARGDIYLFPFRSPDKERPVLILTRESAMDRLTLISVAPITSTIRGVPSEVVLDVADGMKAPCAVNLYNVATVQRAKLGKRLAALSEPRMREVCAALRFALGCD